MSVIYVSHDLNSLKILCDRAILLNKGKLTQTGTPEDVINKYNFLIAKLNDSNNTLNIQEKNSFGTLDAEIKKIYISQDNLASTSFESGANISVKLEIYSKIDISDVTIGIHIRDKYGQDIYGTNTFYQKKQVILNKNNTYICSYDMKLNIGAGKYTLGAALHTQDWHTELCYHWLDNAVNFEILSAKENFSIGLCKLEPTITIKEVAK